MDSFAKRRIRPLILFLAISSMFACALPFGAPAVIPTAVPGSVQTIVAQTAAFAATQTAAVFTATLTPTLTPFPTAIPSDTPTVTPTFVFFLLSPTPVPGSIITPSTPITPSATDYECQLTGQSPADDSIMPANKGFITVWTVANTGRKTWDDTSVDFVYQSGAKLAKGKAADLPNTIAPGDAVSLKISMTAPKNPGTYRTAWSLRLGQNEFCTMTLRIIVQ